MARVEEGEGSGNLDGGFFVVLKGLIVPADFVLFVVEVLGGGQQAIGMAKMSWAHFDCFVVDQRVYSGSGCFVVGSIGLLSELCSPGGGQDGEGSVCSHGGARDGSKLPAILVGLL